MALAAAAGSTLQVRAVTPEADHAQAVTPVDAAGAKPVTPSTDGPGPAVPAIPAAPAAPAAQVPATMVTPTAPPDQATPTAGAQVKPDVAATVPAIAASMPAATTPTDQTGSTQAATGDTDMAAQQEYGGAYRIGAVEVRYPEKHAGQPGEADLANLTVSLVLQKDGAYAIGYKVQDGKKVARVGAADTKLSDLGSLSTHLFHQSAIRGMEEELVRYMAGKGVGGVYVEAVSADLAAANEAAANTDKPAPTLHLVVHIAAVTQVRTIQTGEFVHSGEKIDNPANAAIAGHSPVKSIAQGGDGLFHKDAVDDYVLRLNRQPGRRVDVAVASSDQVDGLIMDYLVTEKKPWLAFAQVSNTGTSQTNQWRERFGFVDNQLTHHDDILTLDYTTAGFDKANMVSGAYDFPMPGVDRLRARVFADYSEFEASDVGQGGQRFTGETESVGAELNYNMFQVRSPFSNSNQHDLFIDMVVGGKYMHVRVNNSSAATMGTADLGLPYVGFRAERSTEANTLFAQINMLSELTGASQDSIDHLGRLHADKDFTILQGNLDYSFYIEPLLDPASYANAKGTLAHELSLSVKGQYAFDNRMIPQQEQVAGGLYTVRGYPESVVAGDSVVIASGEYRFHLPRVLAAAPPGHDIFGKPFRYRPQPGQAFSTPDWDLIFRTFVDVGQVYNSKRESFEENSTLAGTGVGLELLLRQNISLRADWGVALETLDKVQAGGTAVEAGSSRFHMVFTFTY